MGKDGWGQGPGYLRGIMNQKWVLPVLQHTQFMNEGGLRLDAALKHQLVSTEKKKVSMPTCITMWCERDSGKSINCFIGGIMG